MGKFECDVCEDSGMELKYFTNPPVNGKKIEGNWLYTPCMDCEKGLSIMKDKPKEKG